MEIIIKENYDQMSKLAARIIADIVRRKPRCVLGLTAGSTPLGTYRELIRMHQEEGLDFSQVVTFNLDEYLGLPPTHEQSFMYFMCRNLFDSINIHPANVHIPSGVAEDIPAHCKWYEEQIRETGGIDLQLLGIGANGHIGFNEPGSSLGSRTRVKKLANKTVRDNARFFADVDEVPWYAVTMGIATILEAKKLLLLAHGENKAEAIAKTIEGPITAMCPASAVQLHPNVTIILDSAAGKKLTQEYPNEPQLPPFV